MSASDLAIVAALIFMWGAMSARLEALTPVEDPGIPLPPERRLIRRAF